MTSAIRPATPADRDAIARIYIDASLAAVGEAANRAAIQEAAAGRHAMWTALTREDPDYAIAVYDDGTVRAFASVGPGHAGGGDERVGHLFALYVEPSCWDAGMGTRLLAWALGHFEARGIGIAELWVQVENERARAFYERRRSESTGEVRANDRGSFVRYTIGL